jgi:type IV pilus assembly protein PilM
MERHPIAWGLDIGHSSIKAAKLVRTGDQVAVHAYAIEPIVVPENGDREESVIKALEQMALREEFGSTPVIASLSGREVFSKALNIPVLNPKTISNMVELEARQQIPGNFDEVEWGFHMSPAADGASVDVALFAVKREIVSDLIAKTKKSGINLVGLSVSSLALYNFVRYDQVFPDDETVIILDVGAENTDLVFYKGEQLAMYSLSVSGNDITKAFQKKFRLNTIEEAEKLKREVGDSKQAEKVIKVIEGTLAELTSEVQRRIGFYKSQNTECKLDNIVISGSTFKLPGMPEYIAERMRFTVNILEDLDRIKVASGLERDHFMHDLQSLGVAMGLALQGVGAAKAAVNLMPSQQRLERILKQKRWAPIAAIVLLGATSVATWMMTSNIMAENVVMTNKIAEYSGANKKAEEDSRKVLAQVTPKALRLAHFANYGKSQGVSLAVTDSVLQVVQELVVKYGQVGDSAKRAEDGGDPVLQAVYLESIDIPAYDPATSPFEAFAAARTVTVVVRIPASTRQKEVSREIEDRLNGVQVPAAIAEAHPAGAAGRLFRTPVQLVNEKPDDETFHFLDLNFIDLATGDTKPIIQERKVPVYKLTFQCVLPAGKGK